MKKSYHFSTAFIYDDYYENIYVELVDIEINEKKDIKKISLNFEEKIDTSYNFKDINSIIIDVHENYSVKVRKIFQVDFISYHQKYVNTNQLIQSTVSKISLEFDIKNMDVYQDDDMLTIESYVRDRKITKLIE